jgi:imidazolonepropionase
MAAKILIKNIHTLYQVGEDFPAFISGSAMKTIPILQDAFVALEDGVIIAYGKMEDWEGITDWRGVEVIDAEGGSVLPAFCDPHTHTVFARTREEEFVDRINGLTYEEIAAKGGGILNSARRLGELTEEELFEEALKRVQRMKANGTGAVEIKSGYGLSVEAELKILRVIKRLKQEAGIAIKATFLGAHAFPKEYKENRTVYINLIINEMLPAIEKEQLADYIDVFCERNYFTVEEMQQILEAGKRYGLVPKVHVNQFSILGGVKAAVEMGALSVDHLEESNEEDIEALKGSGCMPTFLPGCSHFISIPYGNARKFIDEGLPVALATDYNPGTTPCDNMQTIFSLACVKMRLTPEEALNALTINSAYAMGLSETHGTISLGKTTPLILTKPMEKLSYIPYAFGENHVLRLIV